MIYQEKPYYLFWFIAALVFLPLAACQNGSSDVAQPQPAVSNTTGIDSTCLQLNDDSFFDSQTNSGCASPSPTPSSSTSPTDTEYAALISPQALTDCHTTGFVYNRASLNNTALPACHTWKYVSDCWGRTLDGIAAAFGTSGNAIKDALKDVDMTGTAKTGNVLDQCGTDADGTHPKVVVYWRDVTTEGYAKLGFKNWCLAGDPACS